MDPETSTSSGSSPMALRLREEILSGRLSAGTRLTEAELVKRFGVGRGLVRETLQKLAMEGLLVTRPNRGVVVAPEAPKAIRNLIVPIRRTVEAYALSLIFDELQEEDFEVWDDILSKMREACEQQDFSAVAEQDIAFHRSILERAGQPDLLVIWETLVGRIRSHFRRTLRQYPNPMDIYEEHRSIVDSFRNGSLAKATRLLKEKIQ